VITKLGILNLLFDFESYNEPEKSGVMYEKLLHPLSPDWGSAVAGLEVDEYRFQTTHP
jgi:hypothetical protein